jgi:hypothetical protein
MDDHDLSGWQMTATDDRMKFQLTQVLERDQALQRARSAVRYERHRRFLRRHGLPVPAFMIPTRNAASKDGNA